MAGFFTRDDLKNRLYIRQNQRSLLAADIWPAISGRLYQVAAIRSILERFEQ